MQFYIKVIPVILKEKKEIPALIIQTQLYLNRYNPIGNSFTFALQEEKNSLEFECCYSADAKCGYIKRTPFSYIFTNFSNDSLLTESQKFKICQNLIPRIRFFQARNGQPPRYIFTLLGRLNIWKLFLLSRSQATTLFMIF